VMAPEAKLILELPDLYKCAVNLIEGHRMKAGKHPDQMSMWGLYGDPRYNDPNMCHRWGWTPQSLEAYLKEHGFKEIKHLPTVYHPAGREHRDMRIEAIRA
jgi:hypothetical protein